MRPQSSGFRGVLRSAVSTAAWFLLGLWTATARAGEPDRPGHSSSSIGSPEATSTLASAATPADTVAAADSSLAAQLAERLPSLLVGENLVFSVRYGKIRAGEATLSIAKLDRTEGAPSFHLVSTAASNAVMDQVYPVRDRLESWLDADSLFSRRFEKHLREGKYRQDQVVRFDQTVGRATYHDGKTFDIPRGSVDVIAAFYKVRTMPLEPGAEFFLDSHTDKKTYAIKVKVTGRETVETPAGKFSCLVVEPRLRSGAFFKGDGKLTIWLTDDERRIPVQMKSKIPVGSISVLLERMERPELRASAN